MTNNKCFDCFASAHQNFAGVGGIATGEGGMLAINDDRFSKRAEIIWEKGTNRAEFFRGEVKKYGWVDTGSSFLPSEIIAAFLWAQIENLDIIQAKRNELWNAYYNGLNEITNTVLDGVDQNWEVEFSEDGGSAASACASGTAISAALCRSRP